MRNRIDHVVIGADTLESGTALWQSQAGVHIPPGGKHPAMSTHNSLMQCGDERFVEIIAIDPDAPAPGRRRLFTLDEAATRARLAHRPRALCWVANTDNLDAVLQASPVDLGEPLALSRGELTWRLTVPRDGSLPGSGLLPAFIEWSPGPHPSTAQQDRGVRLSRVRLTHPDPDSLEAQLDDLQVRHLVTVEQGTEALAFEFESPAGSFVID